MPILKAYESQNYLSPLCSSDLLQYLAHNNFLIRKKGRGDSSLALMFLPGTQARFLDGVELVFCVKVMNKSRKI